MAAPPMKEAVVYVLHVGLSDTELVTCKTILSTVVLDKIHFKRSDEVGIVCGGTSETDNTLAEDGEYEHISVFSALEPPQMELVHRIKNMKSEMCAYDVIDALVVAADLLILRTKGKRYRRRIVLLHSASMDVSFAGRRDDLLQSMETNEVQFQVVGTDWCDNEVEGADGTTESSRLLLDFCHDHWNAEEQVFSISQIASSSLLKGIAPSQRSTFKGELQIGNDIGIPINAYAKCTRKTIPSLKALSKYSYNPQANESSSEASWKVQRESTYYDEEDPDQEVPETERIRAYVYGQSLVPFSEADEKAFKYVDSDRCLKVLGFAPRARVLSTHLHYYSGTTAIVPQAEARKAQLAFTSLVRGLYELDRVAIVRFTSRANTRPQLGCLLPWIGDESRGWPKTNTSHRYDCLHYFRLPFVENIRSFTFPSMEKFASSLNEAQLESSDALIDAFDLDKDRTEHVMAVESIHNPSLQYFYTCLQTKAQMGVDEPLPEIPTEIDQMANPWNGALSQLHSEAQGAISSFVQCFPDGSSQQPITAPSRGWNVYDHAARDGKGIESLIDEQQVKNVQPEADAHETVGKEKTFDHLLTAKGSTFQHSAKSIGSATPVFDFLKMVRNRQEDLTVFAVQQMRGVILVLWNTGMPDNVGKLLEAITALRYICITDDEPRLYNDFLRSLKQDVGRNEHLHSEMWSAICGEFSNGSSSVIKNYENLALGGISVNTHLDDVSEMKEAMKGFLSLIHVHETPDSDTDLKSSLAFISNRDAPAFSCSDDMEDIDF